MHSILVAVLLAGDTPRNTGPDFGKASPFGLLVIVLLLIGTFLLVRSMNRHLGKLPESFDPGSQQAADESGAGPSAASNGSADEPGG
ncbi:hypothetical protein [Mycobacterium sp.]|uniref:hypothetical protein n=1 Tax=Mycobacterium sp. TaxID=1785 RepID=UPI00127A9060|nr:hypothetical protein [Mycobacterium sp.]KAA8966298.1 MAG: hypothetical protein F6Q13_07425 [Mycobacterium sp.]